MKNTLILLLIATLMTLGCCPGEQTQKSKPQTYAPTLIGEIVLPDGHSTYLYKVEIEGKNYYCSMTSYGYIAIGPEVPEPKPELPKLGDYKLFTEDGKLLKEGNFNENYR